MRKSAAGQRLVSAVELKSESPEQTQEIGARLALSLRVPGVVLLHGLLGSGKTTLTRGIAAGLGLKDLSDVNSPSYTLINIYHASCPIYHVDLYRLSGSRDLLSIGMDEFLGEDGITIIEWSERLEEKPEDPVEVEMQDAGGDARIIRITSPTGSSPAIISAKKRRGRRSAPHGNPSGRKSKKS
jgi:tRNA threonylcarbamoyladenosine biosynthesis protein TsaE